MLNYTEDLIDRAIQRSSDPPGDQAIETSTDQTSDRAIERMSDGKEVNVIRAPELPVVVKLSAHVHIAIQRDVFKFYTNALVGVFCIVHQRRDLKP